jgi:hypothetical protein
MLTDTAGNIKWRNNYDNLSGQYSQPKEYPKFHNTIDNKYIITVPQYNWQGFSSMIKIDTTGNISLINVMGVSASDIMEQKDKSYMVIGNGPDTIYVTKPANVPTTPEIGIIKVDSLGKGINCVESLSLSPQSYSFNLTSDTIVSQSAGQNKNIGLASSNVSLNVTSGCVQTVMIGSVKNIERNNSILIYPNPVTDKINVISNQCSVNGVEICNILGEKIYQSLVTSHLLSGMSPMTNAPMTSSPIAINVADLTSGVYFIKATTEKGVVVKKFIKQ